MDSDGGRLYRSARIRLGSADATRHELVSHRDHSPRDHPCAGRAGSDCRHWRDLRFGGSVAHPQPSTNRGCAGRVFTWCDTSHTDVDSANLVRGHVRDSTDQAVLSSVYPYSRPHAASSTLHSNLTDMLRWGRGEPSQRGAGRASHSVGCGDRSDVDDGLRSDRRVRRARPTGRETDAVRVHRPRSGLASVHLAWSESGGPQWRGSRFSFRCPTLARGIDRRCGDDE
jgi:hypothetical protein